jgi:hypothetical protein
VTYCTPGSGKALGVSKDRPAKTTRYTAIESSGEYRSDLWASPLAEHATTTGTQRRRRSRWLDTMGSNEEPSERTRSEQADAHRSADRQHALEASRERYTVSVRIAQFVLRGIHAAEQVARRQLSADPHWLALERLVPTETLTASGLVPWVTRRLLRMFRSLASEAGEDGLAFRSLMEGESWSLDVQFGILDRLPVRPDETSEFLRVLLREIVDSAREGGTISGRWGEVQFRSANVPGLVIVPSTRTQVESTVTVSPVRFSRVRRSARGREAGDGNI